MFPVYNDVTCFCSYKNDPEILAMTNLVAAYQRNEIIEFEKILRVSVLFKKFFDFFLLSECLEDLNLVAIAVGFR